MCAVTPSTSETVYSGTGGSDCATRSASTCTGGRLRCSASNRMSTARLRAFVRADIGAASADPAEVVTRAGVDLDLRAGLEEQRHGDVGAGLERRRLGATGGPVALQARLGVGDLQDDGRRQLDVQRGAVVQRHHGVLVLEHEARGVADGRGGHVDLVVRRAVHEDEVLAVLVQVLHVALVDVRGLDLGAGVERLVDDLAGQHRLELGADEGGSLAGLDVLELHHGPELALQVQHHAVLQVVRRCHVVAVLAARRVVLPLFSPATLPGASRSPDRPSAAAGSSRTPPRCRLMTLRDAVRVRDLGSELVTKIRRTGRVAALSAAAAISLSGLTLATPASALAAPTAPTALAPSQSATPVKNLELTWAAVPGATSYDVEFLDDDNPDIARTYALYSGTTHSTTVNRYTVPTNLPVGEWRWRVRANAGGTQGTWSALATLVRGWKGQVSELAVTPEGGSLPTFSWDPLPDASFYEVQFSLAPFDTPAYDRKKTFVCYTASTQLTPYGVVVDNGMGYPAPGNEATCQFGTSSLPDADPTATFVAGRTYHWRVRGRDGAYLGGSTGTGTSTSPLFTTSAGACTGPWLDSGNTVVTTTTGKLDINGQPIYDANGQPVTETKTTLTTPIGGTETLPTEAVTGPECSAWSESSTFVPADLFTDIDPNPGVPAGLAVGPLRTGSTSVVTGDPTFSWTAVPNAVKYRLYLSSDPDLQQNDYVLETTGTRLTPYSGLRLTSTTRYWAVQACTVTTMADTDPKNPATRQDCGDISAIQPISLVSPAAAAPTLTPRSGYLLAGWATAPTARTREQAEFYNLQLTGPNGTVTYSTDRVASDMAVGTSTFVLPSAGLPEGAYTVRIQPVPRSKRPIAWSLSSAPVHIDVTTPTLALTSAAGFDEKDAVTPTFSEPVSNVSAATLGIASAADGSHVPGSVTPTSATTYRFNPSVHWVPGQSYRPWVSPTVVDRAAKSVVVSATSRRTATMVDSTSELMTYTAGDSAWALRTASDAVGLSYRSTTDKATTMKRASASTLVHGTSVTVGVCKSPTSGSAAVFVDGKYVRTVSLNRSWTGCDASIPVTGLAKGTHRVTVAAVASGTKGDVAF